MLALQPSSAARLRLSGIHDAFPEKKRLFPRRLYNTTAFLPLTLAQDLLFPKTVCHNFSLIGIITRSDHSHCGTFINLSAWLETLGEVFYLSLSAVKMTLRSSSREANTRSSSRRLKEEKRHSKSTCSRRESDGLQSSMTCSRQTEELLDTCGFVVLTVS